MQRDESEQRPDDPFTMLHRSHERLRERLEDLSIAAEQRDYEGIDAVLGFFERSVARHEADEERSLFPRLARQRALEAIVATLKSQHEEQADLVQTLGFQLDARDDRGIEMTVKSLRASYEEHIAIEERDLFPAAIAALSAEEKAAMHAEMNERRGR